MLSRCSGSLIFRLFVLFIVETGVSASLTVVDVSISLPSSVSFHFMLPGAYIRMVLAPDRLNFCRYKMSLFFSSNMCFLLAKDLFYLMFVWSVHFPMVAIGVICLFHPFFQKNLFVSLDPKCVFYRQQVVGWWFVCFFSLTVLLFSFFFVHFST